MLSVLTTKTKMASADPDFLSEKPKKRYPGKICSAFGCNNYQGIHKHVSYHSFPTDKELCKRWVHKLRRADLENVDTAQLKARRVCSDHFDTSEFTNANRLDS